MLLNIYYFMTKHCSSTLQISIKKVENMEKLICQKVLGGAIIIQVALFLG